MSAADEIEKMIAQIESHHVRMMVETHWWPEKCRSEAEAQFSRTNPALYELWLSERSS